MSNQPNLNPKIQQPQPTSTKKPLNKTRFIIAAILIAIIATSGYAVYAAFVATGTVTANVGATDAKISFIGLWDNTTSTWIFSVGPNSTYTNAVCSTGFPLPSTTVTCSPSSGVLNPGDVYILRLTIMNTGPVTIPTVTVPTPIGIFTATATYSNNVCSGSSPGNISLALSLDNSYGNGVSSTNNLAVNGTFVVDYSFQIVSNNLLCGGTITVTATATG